MSETKKEKLFKRLEEFKLNKLPQAIAIPALFLVGIWAGRKVILYINKKMGENKISGIAGVDPELAVSVLGALGGLALSQLANRKEFQYLGYGIAAIGMANTVRNVWKKDILSGVDDNTLLPEFEKRNHYLIEGPSEALELNLEDMDEAMHIIENSVQEEKSREAAGNLPANLSAAEEEEDILYS